MFSINFSIDGLLDEIIEDLGYIAGKRAPDEDFFFRVAPCEENRDLLRRFLESQFHELAFAVGPRLHSMSVDDRTLSLSLATEGEEWIPLESLLTGLFNDFLRDGTICRWLMLYSSALAAEWSAKVSSLQSSIAEFCNHSDSDKVESTAPPYAGPRRISPI